ncbi:AraC family transcriptional regulator [Gorillibacterium massiliense]|uniref:AraC family transcriptional regulator n=1 Tax=Gorillibacterium massiliense TaxID=1280390 RepID=UPI0004ADF196|nr:helix-turn-helix domain-containing protein [Gorillibacterium massiliense]
MNILQLTVPPLPHFISCGPHQFMPGHRHLNRQNIRVFDLLYVHSGCLYMGEDEDSFEVKSGQALILSPDRHHFGNRDCTEPTSYHWLHFQCSGPWCLTDNEEDVEIPEQESLAGSNNGLRSCLSEFDVHPFRLRLPRYTTVLQPARMQELLIQLHSLEPRAHMSSMLLRQQTLFQGLLGVLSDSLDSAKLSPHKRCAEQAASYLRMHFRENITAAALGESLNFHPVYIARCMNREYGCSPMEYLHRYRISQSKLLLMQTDYTVARIAEEVGFRNVPYFSSSFLKAEGMTPTLFRKQFL